MTSLHRTRAVEFVEQFCAGNVDGLKSLLAPDLIFRGPYHEFDSRESYLQSLLSDPPEPAGCHLISVTEASDSVAVFYEYRKDLGPLMIAQWFRFRDAAICETLVVFDGRQYPAQSL